MLLRSPRDTRQRRKGREGNRARSLAAAQRCTKWYRKLSWAGGRQGLAEQLSRHTVIIAGRWCPVAPQRHAHICRRGLLFPPGREGAREKSYLFRFCHRCAWQSFSYQVGRNTRRSRVNVRQISSHISCQWCVASSQGLMASRNRIIAAAASERARFPSLPFLRCLVSQGDLRSTSGLFF